MRDSFFTAQNHVDHQLKQSSIQSANEVMEAGVRRVVAIEGPLGAAVRVQRLADICAVAHVLPIDHWRKSPAEETSKPKPKTLMDRIIVTVATHGHWFAAGMIFSMLLDIIVKGLHP